MCQIFIDSFPVLWYAPKKFMLVPTVALTGTVSRENVASDWLYIGSVESATYLADVFIKILDIHKRVRSLQKMPCRWYAPCRMPMVSFEDSKLFKD